MLKRYKYELRPTDTQRVQFDQAIGACRLVYNLALETQLYLHMSEHLEVLFLTLQTTYNNEGYI